MARSMEGITDAFLTMDEAWRFTFLNREAEQLLGRAKEELVGQVAWEAFPEAAGSIFEQQYRKAVAERCTVSFEAYYGPLERWFEIHAYPSGEGVAVHFRDATERRRLESFKVGHTDILERIATGAPLGEVMERSIRLIEEQYPQAIGSILLCSEDGRRLRHGAALNLPPAFIEAIDGIEVGPAAGSCGSAVFRNQPVVVTDIARDPQWEGYQDLAVRHGLRACWSLPIHSPGGRVLGAFAVYYPTSRAPGPGELELVQSSARMVGIALERGQSERVLRESEQRFKLVAKATTDAIWDWDLTTDALWWNDGMEALFGYPPEELEPGIESWTSRLHPEDLDRVVHGIHAVIDEGGTNWSDEYRFRRRDGSYAFALDRGFIIRHESGKPLRMVGGMTDITNQKRAEKEARRAAEIQASIVAIQEEISSAAMELQPVMDLITERVRDLTGATGGVIELLEGDEMVYRAVSGIPASHVGLRLDRKRTLSGLALERGEVLVCDDSETDGRVDREACRKVGARSMVVVPLMADDRAIGVLKVLSGRPRAFAPRDVGNLQILAGTLGSVIQRNRLMEQLRGSEAQYRLLFQDNPHPMWVYDVETLAFLGVNTSAVAQYGYPKGIFLSMGLADLFPPEDQERVARLRTSPSSGRKGPEPSRHLRKDGRVIQVEVTSDDIFFEGRKARLVLVHDVTARMRAESEAERLGRAQRLLSRCNEALIRAQDESSLLSEICEIAVQIGGYRMAWAGYAREDDARSVVPMAHAGVEQGYLDGVAVSWSPDVETGQGPAGRCIRSGEVVIIRNLAADPTFKPWSARALARGYHGLINLPLRSGDRTFGIFSLFSGEPMEISGEEIALLQELADDLAFGISNLRSQEEKRKLQTAVLKVAAGVSGSSGKAFFGDLVRDMADALGADAGFVVRLLPGEPLRARVLASVVDGAPTEPFDYLVEGTPCENLTQAEDCVISTGAAQRYPASSLLSFLGAQAYVGRRLRNAEGRAVGLLFVLFRKPLEQAEFIASTLRIFASRAVMEMGRLESDARLREQASLMDEAREAIIVRDLDHRVRFWNKGAERVYGWSAEEALGRSVADLYPDPAQLHEAFSRLLERGEWNGELQHHRKDGGVLTAECHWTLVRDDQGHPKSVLAINSDITKRLALEEQLKQSQRLEVIGQLTGGVAHDFNNLLTVILGNSDLLAAQLTDNPKLHRMVDMTRAAAQSGAELTKRLLAFARRQPLQPKPVDVNQLLAGMDGMLRRTLGEHIEIEYVRGAGLWSALVDPSQLESAVLNLCVNARDAMKAGGRLTIETANASIDQAYADQHAEVETGQYVLVSVADTGAGILPEHLLRIFEPFFTTKGAGKGTGLGLSMVYGFVKQSRGHIKVYSEIGNGTIVRMYLPRADRAAEVRESPQPAISDFRGTEKILLVEDNDLVRQIAEEQLLALGYRVLLASNGPEALETIQREPDINLLFTDVVMPGGMTGRDLANAALELRPGLRILYTSGYTENAIVHHGRLDRGVHLLSKPYRQIDLARKLRQVLDERGKGSSDI